MMKSNFFIFLSFMLFISAPCLSEGEEGDDEKIAWISSEKVIMQGLDKVTGRVFAAPIKIGHKVLFGSLEVYVKKALRAPPEEPNESVAFVEIYENKPGEKKSLIFKGWMVASEPALNPFDHSVYDVWLKETVVASEVPLVVGQKIETTTTQSLPGTDSEEENQD